MLRRLGTAVAAVVALTLLAVPALASGPAGTLGNDVSWPQCGSDLPATGSFGIVGVNERSGRTTNPCLATQTTWAAGRTYAPALYILGANPGPVSPIWPTTSSGPVTCKDPTSFADYGCVYDYGWALATDALSRASAITAFDPLDVTWFVDVESANTYDGSGTSNTASVQGMVDRLRFAGIPSVGIYSSPGEWPDITGGYTVSTAASYRAAWAPFFRPAYPLELGPLWLAGGTSAVDAANRCSLSAVTQAPPLMTQYVENPGTSSQIDVDYQCAAESTDTTAPVPAMTTPNLVNSFDSTAFGWTSDGGASSYDARYRVATATAAFGSYLYPSSTQVTTGHSLPLSLNPGRTYCGSVRARDARANLSAWSAEKCTTTPVDDRSLTATSAWSRVTASGHYRSTYTQSTTNGQYLKTTVQARRLALVATTCARCGSVAVYVNGSLLATKSLYAGSTRTKQVIALPAFSFRSATVLIKVVSPTGKVVQVDGLVASRV